MSGYQPPRTLDRRWLKWVPWVRQHLVVSGHGSMEDMKALHRLRVERCLAVDLRWETIIRYDLDDPRAEDYKFDSMLEWAVSLKRNRRRKVAQ